MPAKRRRRFQGLYYHSSPPKVLPMNGQLPNESSRRKRETDDFSVKLSTIRIWMHEKDIGKLTRILWAGQGNRLRQQASTNAKVKRFLAAVPYVMNSIRDVHQAVIDNSLETLQAKLEPPVPPSLVTCRDANGLNLIHKAAGLGHATILEYLITTWPDGVNDCDITGKTPLHWAASAKNNMRCYTLLTQAGCDEEVVDYKMKTPSFYRHKPHEIERAFLLYVPEAPRVAPDIATDWEALSDDSGDGRKLDIKIPDMNGFGRHSNAESNENTSEAEMTEGASAADDEDAGGGDTEAEPEAEPEPETEPEPEPEPDTEAKSQGEEEATEHQAEEEQPEEDENAKEEDEGEDETKADAEEQPAHEEESEAPDEKQTQSNNESATEATADNDEKDQEQEQESNKSEVAESLEYGGVVNEEKNNKTGESSTEEIKDIDDIIQQNNKDIIHEKEVEDIQENNKDVSQEKEIEDIQENTKDVSQEKEIEDIQENTKDVSQEKEVEDIQENTKDVSQEKKVEDIQENTKDVSQEKQVEDIQENTKDVSQEKEVKDIQDNTKDVSQENQVEDIQEKTKDVSQEKEVEDIEDNGNEIKESSNIEEVEEGNQKSELHKIEKVNGEEFHAESHKDKAVKEEERKNEVHQETKEKEEIEEEDEEVRVESDKNDVTKPQEDAENSENLQKDDKKEIGNEINESEEKEDNKTSVGNITEEKGKQEHEAKDKETDRRDEQLKDTDKEDKEEIKEQNVKDTKESQEATKETKLEAKDDKTAKEPYEAKDTLQPKNEAKTDQEESNENHEPKVKRGNDNDSVSNKKSESNSTNSSDDKNGKAKTDEDENNNKSTTNLLDVEDEDANDVVEIKTQKLSDISEEVQENGESFLQEAQHDISDKFDEITENLKDNVKILTDKIKNVFSSSDEKEENSDVTNGNDKNEVVVRSASPLKSAKRSTKNGNKETKRQGVSGDGESSDDDDEDEETETAETAADDGEANGNKVDNQSPADEGDAAEANASAGDSPTSSLAIEGFIQGEAEDNTVQSQTAAYDDDDNDETRLSRVIASGDMEQLAQIVLNGDGQKLLDVKANEPEIQAFLRNVPNYMDKIRRVHEASRSGSLLNLQQALDRRKFAVAKDEISPNGATPLHVAVLFGHSDIVRYLAARFPETTAISDNDGRTALHYAAVINDNGHFYNVLIQLGANPKALDKMGKTPEQYLTNDELKQNFNYGQLSKIFGAEDLESKLLSDQGQIENHSFQENPIFKTEQGKYLADNLADPLIKALTQVAHIRPQDPLQYLTNYLQNFATTRNTNGKTLVHAAVHSGSSHTNSTALANSNPSPPPAQMRQYQTISQMNGHVRYDNTDDIENESLEQLVDDDDGNDSDAALSKKLEERDEHGQSMLHFASARLHRRGGFLHLIEESKADITYRDELYRTARDVALQANQVGNAKDIDRYLISLAVVGDVKPFENCALSGYDHIIDVMDENEVSIIDIAESKGHTDLAAYLKSIRPMEEMREELHQGIRDLKVERVSEIANSETGKMLIMAKNYYGRTALHIAILKESQDMIEEFVNICPEALKIGDNLERTPLHYAMGTNLVEGISRVLIQNGAKRTNKDLKGRQPSYYFMNKADILRLQEEEDESR